ncbi:MAG TPA: hypothetical protein VIC06_08040 [Solirubrobacteraceae bacterium]
MSGGAKLTALLGAVLAFALGVPACAGAANTLVGFDDLSAGTLVTSQYQAQGLLFGTAAGFSQTSPGAGDCGLRLRRQGSTALLTWAAVPGARVYRVKVRGSDGRVLTLTATPRRRGIVIAQVLPFQSFTRDGERRGWTQHALRARCHGQAGGAEGPQVAQAAQAADEEAPPLASVHLI